MLSKIKGLMQTSELVNQINKKVEDHSAQVGLLKDELACLSGALHEIKSNQTEFLTNFKDNLQIINESKENLRKEIYDFKLLKAELQKGLLEKFEEELNNCLRENVQSIKVDSDEYSRLKEMINDIAGEMENLSNEIKKFSEVSKNIKKGDFELAKFGKQLLDMDKEKLELMKKIDTLERLVARMRRNR